MEDSDSSLSEISSLIQSHDGVNTSGTFSSGESSEMQTFTPRVYGRRWWMLIVVCSISFTQGLLWNSWSPVGDAMLISYGWSDSFLALALAMGTAGVVVFAFPIMYLIETRGLRIGAIMAVVMLLFGVVAWNIGLPANQNWLVVMGTASIGVVNCIALSAAPLLSVSWFPVAERTTATAFATMSTYGGLGSAFVIGPYVSGANVTASDIKHRANLTHDFISSLQNGIQHVVYLDTALVALCFLLVMIYFPTRPPSPPSKAQATGRIDFWPGLKSIARNYQFWTLTLSFNIANGTYNAWLPLMSVNFADSLSVDEVTAGWIGFTSTMMSCVGSIGVALLVDRFKKRTKFVLKMASACSIALFAVLSCIQDGYITIPTQSVTGALYAICIAIALCMNGVVPLYYELGCEITYPVHEGLSSTFITVMNDVCGLFFYALFAIPAMGHSSCWMTWACLGACTTSLPLLISLKETYNRLNVETTAN